MNRMMTLVAFLQAQNCSNLPGSWRHPSTMLDFTTPEYYQRIARTLEDGKIQLAFFDDRLALPDLYTGDHAEAVAAGVRVVKMDPSTILMAMGMATSKLGLGTTYSTTYYEPFHVARVFATMDLMLKGRAAWNIVTSLNSAEALNFGVAEHMEHDARYDRADEFMQVVMGHWNTWEDDSLVLDKAGRFADPAKVHRLDHVGKYFKSRGPFSVPRSAQGHPVLIQAGQSGRGQAPEDQQEQEQEDREREGFGPGDVLRRLVVDRLAGGDQPPDVAVQSPSVEVALDHVVAVLSGGVTTSRQLEDDIGLVPVGADEARRPGAPEGRRRRDGTWGKCGQGGCHGTGELRRTDGLGGTRIEDDHVPGISPEGSRGSGVRQLALAVRRVDSSRRLELAEHAGAPHDREQDGQ